MSPAGMPLLSDRYRSLLDALKYRGQATVPALAAQLDLNVETVREHLRTLEASGVVRRQGSERRGPGRPEIVWVLTELAEPLFPRREGETLRGLARYLVDNGQTHLLSGFLQQQIAERRRAGLKRVEGLSGEERARETRSILDEMGFMPVLEENGDTLRLCHCPLRDLVAATDLPCKAEIELLRELLGGSVRRIAHMPDGDTACAYRMCMTQ
ncbi:MAG TPA: helix-turn-helix domain-containing protein [Gemmatimonadales bacterium]|nr:helix-turn-helix domain-containing protein [Gemmatimonadales bacterium]